MNGTAKVYLDTSIDIRLIRVSPIYLLLNRQQGPRLTFTSLHRKLLFRDKGSTSSEFRQTIHSGGAMEGTRNAPRWMNGATEPKTPIKIRLFEVFSDSTRG